MGEFEQAYPSLESYWRAIILLGRNVASYKFALGQSLLELSKKEQTFIPLQELAEPFSRHISEHIRNAEKQITSKSSRFLENCKKFNRGEISKESLVEGTVRLGFNNVIDAFHMVNNGEIPVKFFVDERRKSNRGITVTDDFFKLCGESQYQNLPQEVEARWRLVETAWELDLPTRLVAVSYDAGDGLLFTENRSSNRISITPCREALNGYQKGKCFYCFRDISIAPEPENPAEVDHFFPHVLKTIGSGIYVDGIWNLVLSCKACNRGLEGKSARIPGLRYLERLHTRNEFLITSHHPLRETLILQAGASELKRRVFLQDCFSEATKTLIHTWEATDEQPPAF